MSLHVIVFTLCLPVLAGFLGIKKQRTPTDRLAVAVARGDLLGAEAALDQQANVNGGRAERGDYGYKHNTPLNIAANNKDIPMMEMLIRRGADVNARSGATAGVLPLQSAIALGMDEQNKFAKPELAQRALERRIAAVKLLLAKGADPGRYSRIGSTPLSTAAGTGTLVIVELLLSKGASPHGTGSLDQPLHEAARAVRDGSAGIATALINKGSKVTATQPPGLETPLHTAASFGNVPVAKALLARGAKVNAMDKSGSTPLHIAAAGNRLEMVRLLLEHGANRKAQDAEEQTPQQRAKSPVVAELLK